MKVFNTQGDEFVNSLDQTIYSGSYYIKGEQYWSWDGVNDILSDELFPVIMDEETYKYKPTPSTNTPTIDHYSQGSYIRYFCREKGKFEYMEIDETTYNAIVGEDECIAWKSYDVVSCEWKLSGEKEEIYTHNRKRIYNIINEGKWFGLQYFINEGYLKYCLSF